jgi:hypothetical protein
MSLVTNELAQLSTWEEGKMPESIITERNLAQNVPTDVVELCLPPNSIAVTRLLDEIPSTISTPNPPTIGFSTDCPSACFHPSSPNFSAAIIALTSSPLPHPTSMTEMRNSFNSAWLAGKKSLVINGRPHLRYPLWCVRFVSDLEVLHQTRGRWLSAFSWLDNLRARAADGLLDHIRHCYQRLALVPSKDTVPGFSRAIQLGTLDLSCFLGRHWMNDEIINAGGEYIIQNLPESTRSLVVNTFLIPQLNNHRFARPESPYVSPRNRLIDEKIQLHQLDTLWIPYFREPNHWTVIKVDLVLGQIMYQDSLDPSSSHLPSSALLALQWWLETLLPNITFSAAKADFMVPHQHDSHSCGIIVLSVISTNLLSHECWSQERADFFRLRWFLNLSRCYHESSGLGSSVRA